MLHLNVHTLTPTFVVSPYSILFIARIFGMSSCVVVTGQDFVKYRTEASRIYQSLIGAPLQPWVSQCQCHNSVGQ